MLLSTETNKTIDRFDGYYWKALYNHDNICNLLLFSTVSFCSCRLRSFLWYLRVQHTLDDPVHSVQSYCVDLQCWHNEECKDRSFLRLHLLFGFYDFEPHLDSKSHSSQVGFDLQEVQPAQAPTCSSKYSACQRVDRGRWKIFSPDLSTIPIKCSSFLYCSLPT